MILSSGLIATTVIQDLGIVASNYFKSVGQNRAVAEDAHVTQEVMMTSYARETDEENAAPSAALLQHY